MRGEEKQEVEREKEREKHKKISEMVLSKGQGQEESQNKACEKQHREECKRAIRIPSAGPRNLLPKFRPETKYGFNSGSNFSRNQKWGLKEMMSSETGK